MQVTKWYVSNLGRLSLVLVRQYGSMWKGVGFEDSWSLVRGKWLHLRPLPRSQTRYQSNEAQESKNDTWTQCGGGENRLAYEWKQTSRGCLPPHKLLSSCRTHAMEKPDVTSPKSENRKRRVRPEEGSGATDPGVGHDGGSFLGHMKLGFLRQHPGLLHKTASYKLHHTDVSGGGSAQETVTDSCSTVSAFQVAISNPH